MADEILGTAQIEIIASLDQLRADLEQARAMVADAGLDLQSGGLGSPAISAGLLGLLFGGDSQPAGGVDNQLAAASGAAGAPVTVNVHNYSGSPATTRQSQNPQGGKSIDVVIGEMNARDVRTNGPLGQAIRQQYGASTVPIQR